MAFEDKKKKSFARELGKTAGQLRKAAGHGLTGAKMAGKAIAAEAKVEGKKLGVGVYDTIQEITSGYSETAPTSSGGPATTTLGDSAQRGAGGTNNTKQHEAVVAGASAEGAQAGYAGADTANPNLIDTSPEARQRAGAVEFGLLARNRPYSPGQQGTRIGAFDAEGNAAGAKDANGNYVSGGGTLSSVGAQQSTTGRDRAFNQLAALRGQRTGPLYRGGGSEEPTGPTYAERLADRNSRVGAMDDHDIMRAMQSGRLSPRGLQALERVRSNQAGEELARQKLSQEGDEFGQTLARTDRGLDIKEGGIASNENIAAAKLGQASQVAAQKQANLDRSFGLDAAKFGLSTAQFGETQRKNYSGEELARGVEERKVFETGLKAAKNRQDRSKIIQGLLVKGQEGGASTDSIMSSVLSTGEDPSEVLQHFKLSNLKEGSWARDTYLQIEQEQLKAQREQVEDQ